MTRVLVLNGPNLGRLGTREPEIYGTTTHAELAALCRTGGAELGLDVEVRQTDHEGELLGWLHEAADTSTPVVLNAGGPHAHLGGARRRLRDAHRAADRGAHQQRPPARAVPPHELRLAPTPPASSPGSGSRATSWRCPGCRRTFAAAADT